MVVLAGFLSDVTELVPQAGGSLQQEENSGEQIGDNESDDIADGHCDDGQHGANRDLQRDVEKFAFECMHSGLHDRDLIICELCGWS